MQYREPVIVYALPREASVDVDKLLSFLRRAGKDCQPGKVMALLLDIPSVSNVALMVVLVVQTTDEDFASQFVNELADTLADSIQLPTPPEFYMGSLLGLFRLAGSDTGDEPLDFHQTWPTMLAQIISKGQAFTESGQPCSITGDAETKYKEAVSTWLRLHGRDQVATFLETLGKLVGNSRGKAIFDLILFTWLSTTTTNERVAMMKQHFSSLQES